MLPTPACAQGGFRGGVCTPRQHVQALGCVRCLVRLALLNIDASGHPAPSIQHSPARTPTDQRTCSFSSVTSSGVRGWDPHTTLGNTSWK